jgi:hypothetical protein
MRIKLLYGFVVLFVVALMFAPTHVSAAIVTCEPQGGPNPVHPTTYFYDVNPQNNFT